MVKLYASLLSLTLTTSLALAVPLPSYTHGVDEEFSRREYLFDASDDLAAREPNIFGSIKKAFKSVSNVAVKGLHAAESVARNPLFQAAVSVIPGGAGVIAAEKAVETIGKVERLANKAKEAGHKVQQLEHLGKKAIRSVKHIAPAHRRHHRRDLEDDEELSRRGVDAEVLFAREYDDFLVERDFFDDLD